MWEEHYGPASGCYKCISTSGPASRDVGILWRHLITNTLRHHAEKSYQSNTTSCIDWSVFCESYSGAVIF